LLEPVLLIVYCPVVVVLVATVPSESLLACTDPHVCPSDVPSNCNVAENVPTI
jgi:hypothetical protein